MKKTDTGIASLTWYSFCVHLHILEKLQGNPVMGCVHERLRGAERRSPRAYRGVTETALSNAVPTSLMVLGPLRAALLYLCIPSPPLQSALTPRRSCQDRGGRARQANTVRHGVRGWRSSGAGPVALSGSVAVQIDWVYLPNTALRTRRTPPEERALPAS